MKYILFLCFCALLKKNIFEKIHSKNFLIFKKSVCACVSFFYVLCFFLKKNTLDFFIFLIFCVKLLMKSGYKFEKINLEKLMCIAKILCFDGKPDKSYVLIATWVNNSNKRCDHISLLLGFSQPSCLDKSGILK